MTEANRRPDTLEARGFKTVATLVIGPQTYLVMEDNSADIRLDPVDPADQVLYYHKQTKLLPPDATVRFDGIDPRRVTIAQIGTAAPAVTYTERVSGTDEIKFRLSAYDEKRGQTAEFELLEPELRDLFLKDRKPSSANFFRIDTAGGSEIVGFAVKRNFPMMFLLTPGKDGVNHSPAEGLLTFLSHLHDKLMERPTGLQWKVNERIYSALLEEELVFKSAATTASQKRLQEIQKRIYMIQAVILAKEAEDHDGDQDAALLAHAPFLNDPVPGRVLQKKGGGLSRLFIPQVALPIHQKKQVVLDTRVWTNLLAKTDKNLIDTPQARLKTNPTTPFAQPSKPINHTPAPRPLPTPTPKPTSVPIFQPKPTPEAPRIDEKQAVINLAANIEQGIQDAFGIFKDTDLSNLSSISLLKLQNQLRRLAERTDAYFKARAKRALMPDILAEITIKPIPSEINLGGVDAKLIFEFLDRQKTTNAREKIANAFRMLDSMITPMQAKIRRTERKISTVNQNTALLREMPEVRDELLPAIKDVLAKSRRAGDDVNVVEFAQYVLTLQVLYALQRQYRGLKEKGTAGEIDNWISFTRSTLQKLKSLPIE